MATVSGRQRIEALVRSGKLVELFIEERGWDTVPGAPIEVPVQPSKGVEASAAVFTLRPIAQKRGVQIYACAPDADGRVPTSQVRTVIDRELTKVAHEHLIVFHDDAWGHQIWQWPDNTERGRPRQTREIELRRGTSAEFLMQRLERIAFDIEEEDALTLVDVRKRLRDAAPPDAVTRRFYDRFSKERTAFEGFIQGIKEQGDRAWYASLMLNRLMFVYFIQQKGFLNGEHDYLETRLRRARRGDLPMPDADGSSRFLTFYRRFLLRLFHAGLGQPAADRDPALRRAIGDIPYLNGGLFDVHELEDNDEVDIPDEAFDRLFAFFGEYQWHLDDRPLAAGNEINPDVLGYIFEKFINQKEMGAYYTKEDITGYICQNTILPYILDAARRECGIAFRPDEAGNVWALLRDDPDRYLYPAVRHGVIDADGEVIPLPPEIEVGIDDVSQRSGWNARAGEPYGLPTETWREHVHRRQRCLELRGKMRRGEVHSVDDLVTLNLDIRQFAQDVVDLCGGPDLVRACYRAIRNVTVLDPTCGSGAFLFAALNVLAPLHLGCLRRMRGFVADLGREPGVSPKKYDDFQGYVADANKHPSETYHVLRQIVLNNLYGVDIMPEAVEVCKLRLFLKLVAQLDDRRQVEPLPDIDFNIRAGNTLVGFARFSDAERDVSGRLGVSDVLMRVGEQAADYAHMLRQFQEQQSTFGGVVRRQDKDKLRRRILSLASTLNAYLAEDEGVSPTDEDAYADWLERTQPFHWFVDFNRVVQSGGFSVVIGNPPWKEYAAVRNDYQVRGYATQRAGNLHCFCTERAVNILAPHGRLGFIVQLPVVSSARMRPVRTFLRDCNTDVWTATFDDRPGKLFDGLQHCRSTIILSRKGTSATPGQLNVTRYHRWPTETRPVLFETVAYTTQQAVPIHADIFPKTPSELVASVFTKVGKSRRLLGHWLIPRATDFFVFYQEATQYWVKATVGLPYYAKNGVESAPAHGRYLYFESTEQALIAGAILNSSLFFVHFVAYGDGFHVSNGLVSTFPVNDSVMADECLAHLSKELMQDLGRNAETTTIRTRAGDTISYAEFYAAKSKPLIDQIDARLADHYGFTAEESDAVANFDAKFRL